MTRSKLAVFSIYILRHFCVFITFLHSERHSVYLKDDQDQTFGTTQTYFPAKDVNLPIDTLCLS